MSGMPKLAAGQKYDMKCCKCEGSKIARGVVQIREPEGEDTWTASEAIIEFQCDRLTCKTVSYLVIRSVAEGTTLQWRSIKDDPRIGRFIS